MVGRLALIAALLVAVGACGGQSTPSDLSGQVVADGSSTVFPVTQAVAERFKEEAPGVQVSVGTSSTADGFEKFCRGETDISNASRPMSPEEAEVCERNGVGFVELKVALDGLSVLVNPENAFAECLTVAELKKIWEPGSTVNNWQQVRADFPDRPLTLYGPDAQSGTFDYFTEAVVGEAGKSRSDYTASEDDNVLVQGVAEDPNALAYFGFAYYQKNLSKLKTVAVDSGAGCVRPLLETIRSDEYKPLSRPLFIYVSTKAAGREEVSTFVDFYLENVSDLMGDVKYVALPEAEMAKSRQAWQGRPT